MAVRNKKDMGYLGEDFQYRLAHELITDHEFFKDLYDIIDQNMFTDPNLKTVVGVMKEHYAKYENVPSYSILKQHLFERSKNDIEREYYNEIVEKIHHTPTESAEYTRDLAVKFFKQQNIIKAANEILRIAGNGDVDHYDRCVEILTKTLSAGEREDLGSTPFENQDEVLSDDYRIAIPTGIGKIDETLEGGLGKGELGAIVGPSSFGKALSVNELVFTPNGVNRVSEIKVGDYLIGSDGKPTKVLGVYPQPTKRPIYKVTFTDGTSYECDEEHILPVNTYYQRRGSKYNKALHKKVYNPDLSFTNMTLREIMNRGLRRTKNVYNFATPVCKPVQFEKKNIDYDPYTFGISLDNNKCIPIEYLTNDLEGRIRLLQGLADTDRFTIKNGHCNYNTKSKQLAEDLCFLVRSLGGIASINMKDGVLDGYEISFGLFDKNIKISTLEWKQSRVRYLSDIKFHKFIESIEYVREDDATCFLVDADDHLFLTRDFNVTHNTSLTTAIAAHAATYKCEQNNGDGFKVLQLVFEDRIKQIQRKHFGRITGVEAKDLSKEQYLDYVKEQLKNYEDRDMLNSNLRIVRWPSGERSAWDVEKLIKKLRNNGFSPDLVIVDYFECLAPKKGSLQKDDWSKEAENMRKFEAMAGEMNIAFWIPIQGTRESINAEIVTMDKAGGSFKKIQIAHIVMTIARTTEDIENNLATIAILKNRAGCSGKIFNNVEFNNGTCRISTDNVDEFDSMAMFNKKKKADEVEFQRSIFEEVRAQSKSKPSG